MIRTHDSIECFSWWLIHTMFFECSEVVFDGIEVWGIGREEKDSMSVGMSEGCNGFLLMKRCIIEDERGVGMELLEEMMFKPMVDP